MTTEWVTPPRPQYSASLCEWDTVDYKNTKCYQYLMDDRNTSHISDKIWNIVNEMYAFHCDSLGNENVFHSIYKKLFDDNLFEIIYEIIDGTDAIDNFVICKIAIDTNNYDILDFAIAKGFNIRKENSVFKSDILTHSVCTQNFELCRYLVSKGASPFDNNCMALTKSCHINKCDIFEYFLELGEINNEQLKILLHESISAAGLSNTYTKIKKILEKGLDLNSLDQKFFDSVAYSGVDIFRYLFENGLEFNSNILLGAACVSSNCDLAKICLENGSRPNDAILEKILNNLNLPMIKLFLQYGIDFSLVPVINEFDDLISELEKNGMVPTNWLNVILRSRSKTRWGNK